MNADDFQREALRTFENGDDPFMDFAVLGLGLTGESGEFVDRLKKVLGHGHSLDAERPELKLELGDVAWYVAVLAHKLGFNLSEVLESNVQKLRSRYPNGFESERSQNRGEDRDYAEFLKLTAKFREHWEPMGKGEASVFLTHLDQLVDEIRSHALEQAKRAPEVRTCSVCARGVPERNGWHQETVENATHWYQCSAPGQPPNGSKETP